MYINKNGVRSERASDMEREKNMQKALNRIYKQNGIDFVRVSEKKLQCMGMDLLVKSGNDTWVIADEKAATARPDAYHKLKTFCFELSALNNPNGNGWLFNPNSKTSYFILIFPCSEDNFHTLNKAEIIILKKELILNILDEIGIRSKTGAIALLNTSDEYDRRGRHVCRIDKNMKLVHSTQLAEQPLNLIIDREYLRELAVKVIDTAA